jgi:hypothetical protein
MDFSVIVPVYREEDRINGLAGHVLELARRDSAAVEIVVATGDRDRPPWPLSGSPASSRSSPAPAGASR